MFFLSLSRFPHPPHLFLRFAARLPPRRPGAAWTVGRRAHAPAAAGHATSSPILGGGLASPLSTASTARGGGASSPLRMVATEPALKPARCVRGVWERLVGVWVGAGARGGRTFVQRMSYLIGHRARILIMPRRRSDVPAFRDLGYNFTAMIPAGNIAFHFVLVCVKPNRCGVSWFGHKTHTGQHRVARSVLSVGVS